MKRLLFFCLCCFFLSVHALDEYTGATWVEHPENRADAFFIRVHDREIRVQLYFVEAPHPAPTSEDDRARAETDARYYGLESAEVLRALAANALAATRSKLNEPFTVHTRFTPVPGAEDDRVYAFVSIRGGSDLAAFLVRSGHARARGPGWQTPRGIPAGEMAAILADAEDAAQLERAGIWGHTNPVRLPALRAQNRRMERTSAPETVVRTETPPAPPTVVRPAPAEPVNVNTAEPDELMQLPNVDNVLAGRIIRGRPYRTPRDLLDVRGIGENLLRSWDGMVVTR